MSPSRERRRVRRAAERNVSFAETEAENAENTEEFNEEVTEEVTSNDANHEALEAGKAPANEGDTDKLKTAEKATKKQPVNAVAEEASTENVQCELCDLKFGNKRGLNIHVGLTHKVIPQLDGCGEEKLFNCIYTFESDYAEEDIEYTLVEVFTDIIDQELVSRVKIGSERSANHLCTVRLTIPNEWQWPVMTKVQKEVIKSLKRPP